MPVVPFSPRQPQAPREISAADEPWVLMAAAQMDAQGRLIVPQPTEAQMSRAMANLKNGMAAAQDPTEGDFFMSEKDKTISGTIGNSGRPIRQYKDDE